MNGGHPAIAPGTLPLRTVVVLFLDEQSSRTEYAGLDLGLECRGFKLLGKLQQWLCAVRFDARRYSLLQKFVNHIPVRCILSPPNFILVLVSILCKLEGIEATACTLV